MNASDRTPADLLRSALAADPARPLVTFYDDATGERVELSVATFANWVAKTANLLQGEMSAEPGERLALLVPAHWQSAVWLLACSSVGVVADIGGDPAAADHVVAGPGRFEDGLACRGERIALSLAPMGRRFTTPPAGWADYAVEVPSQGDRFAPYAPVDPEAEALTVAGVSMTGAELVERARADARRLGLDAGGRVLSGLGYDTWEGVGTGLFAPLAAGASVVLCRNLGELSDDGLAKRVESERVSLTVR
ncbi:TIGR03089 family protein [Streptomyces zhihengii]|uniref:TIGR03089 family protein n=1 Tax=Streptomyces zhihengii TaxID=1818004 RepID=A0ABS2UUN6_9ACTN|nr:TIGR03089 family protein [Streptomyces zhihengii]MBM9621227.1 TIGR03089 family protein [Streptomyces zhihengii]